MKKQIIVFLGVILIMAGCKSDQHSALYTSFTGMHPAKQIKNESGELIHKPEFEVNVRFDKKNLYIGDEVVKYSIVEETDEYLKITADIKHRAKDKTILMKYMMADNTLTILSEKPENNIKLYSLNDFFEKKLEEFAEVPLSTDISHLTDNQKEMLKILFQIADIMEEIYWIEAYGDKNNLLNSTEIKPLRRLYEINYGPWERLNDNIPFTSSFEEKPAGAGFYPADMTMEEFEAFDDPAKKSLYTMIQRNEQGKLESKWYHDFFSDKVKKASELLLKASELAEDEGFKNYLKLRADAMLTDNYYDSDVEWMLMKDNQIDFVVGPIENYEDHLFNCKAAHESFILVKDMEWSKKIGRLAQLLPMLQKELPVDQKFKQESAGTDSDLNVYDAIYYAGDCNAGSKTIAINLPNDPEVRSKYGSRKLQLKNSIKYKFDRILVPIANVLIAEDQRKYVDFNAFFENTMFHEVAHGLGVDYTINGKGTVREALVETYTPFEESKADILGLYIVDKLTEMNELGDKDLMTNYVTFMASIFRSVRFGAASAHGKANMIRFYYFQEAGAFTRDEVTGTYRVNFEKMKEAMNALTNEIISIQGTGNYEKAKEILADKGYIRTQLQQDLERLNELSIPVDLVFKQGPQLLGLE